MPANFLIAVREDAYGGLGDLFSGRISNVYNNYLHLEYLTREAAREAIEKPVEVYNAEHDQDEAVTLDDDLTDAVLDEVRRGNLKLGARSPDRDGEGSWSRRERRRDRDALPATRHDPVMGMRAEAWLTGVASDDA